MAEILVVDDDAVTLKVIRKVLKDAGHHVILASDGTRALEVLEDNSYIEMIITDVIMPRLDGRDLVAALRRDSRFSEIPTLIMSATIKVSEIVKLLESGASRFVAKPVRGEKLLAEVNACLAPPRDHDEAANG